MSKIPNWSADHGEQVNRWVHKNREEVAVEVRQDKDDTYHIFVIEGGREKQIQWGSGTEKEAVCADAVRLLSVQSSLSVETADEEIQKLFQSPIEKASEN